MERSEYRHSAEAKNELCLNFLFNKILNHQFVDIQIYALLFPAVKTLRGMIHKYEVSCKDVPYCFFIMFVLHVTGMLSHGGF